LATMGAPPGLGKPPGLQMPDPESDSIEAMRQRYVTLANIASLKQRKADQQATLAKLLEQAADARRDIRALDDTLEEEMRWLENVAPAYCRGASPRSPQMFDETSWAN